MNHLGRTQRLEIGGKVYRVSRYERRLLREWHQWAREQLTNPLNSAAEVLDWLEPETQRLVINEAADRADELNDPLSPLIQELVSTWEGQREALAILLADANLLPMHEARSLIDDAREGQGEDELTNILLTAQGRTMGLADVSRAYYQELGLVRSVESKHHPVDWLDIDRKLVEHFSLKPWELDRLTISELFTLYQKEQEVNSYDATEMVKAYNKLTPTQQLILAFRHYHA